MKAIDNRAILEEAIEVINDYLQAGCKETRKKASVKAKAVYKKYHNKDYTNKLKADH